MINNSHLKDIIRQYLIFIFNFFFYLIISLLNEITDMHSESLTSFLTIECKFLGCHIGENHFIKNCHLFGGYLMVKMIIIVILTITFRKGSSLSVESRSVPPPKVSRHVALMLLDIRWKWSRFECHIIII